MVSNSDCISGSRCDAHMKRHTGGCIDYEAECDGRPKPTQGNTRDRWKIHLALDIINCCLPF
jgi:hypothetical protein